MSDPGNALEQAIDRWMDQLVDSDRYRAFIARERADAAREHGERIAQAIEACKTGDAHDDNIRAQAARIVREVSS